MCGIITQWMDGLEIKAHFIDIETGESILFHDVFTDKDKSAERSFIISGLAIKFRDSFPICEGEILKKKDLVIHIDIGKKEGIFPGMRYNIFKTEKELISKASIKNVTKSLSKAKITEAEKSESVGIGYKVRTR